VTHVEPLPVARRQSQNRDREQALFQRFHSGRDPALRDQLVTRYLPMARRIAKVYARRQARVAFEDLEQVASIGLIKSVDRFDPATGAAFVAFAEPTIRGEIFRHFREFTWAVRPPRELQERALQIERVSSAIIAELGRAPSPAELSRYLGLSVEQVMDGLAACRARDGASFDRTNELETDEGFSLRDIVGSEDVGYAHAEDSATVMHLMRVLTAREKRVLLLRFGADLTQAEVGEIIGCTQMHVSRIQRDALAKLSIVAGANPLLEPATGARTTRGR
jgi:RNA polymerase sigma-B factor